MAQREAYVTLELPNFVKLVEVDERDGQIMLHLQLDTRLGGPIFTDGAIKGIRETVGLAKAETIIGELHEQYLKLVTLGGVK